MTSRRPPSSGRSYRRTSSMTTTPNTWTKGRGCSSRRRSTPAWPRTFAPWRSAAFRRSTRRGWLWALVQVAVVGAEIFALLFLLAQPAFLPRHIEVVGLKHLTEAEVTGAMNLPGDRNIFQLSQAELAKRLQALPWVRSASVNLSLPDRVSVKVTEWTPSAALQVGGTTYYLNTWGSRSVQ